MDDAPEKTVSKNGVLHILRSPTTRTLCGKDAWFWDYWGVDDDTPADCLSCVKIHRLRTETGGG